MDFFLSRLSDRKAGGPTMLHPAESSFTGGGHLVLVLPEVVRQKLQPLRQPRFSLVFEGRQRRHVVSCRLVDDSCLVSVIPEHQPGSERVELLLFLHEGDAAPRSLLQLPFTFTATEPFDAVAEALLAAAARPDLDFPPTWEALIRRIEAAALPPDWSHVRLLDHVSAAQELADSRLAAALRRRIGVGRTEAANQSRGLANGAQPPETALAEVCPGPGRFTALHFLAAHGLVESTGLLLRLVPPGAWCVPDADGTTPGRLADLAGHTEFALLLNCPQSIERWVAATAEAAERATSGESVASISHRGTGAVVMTTNKVKSGLEIEQDVQIHKAVEDSEASADANQRRRVALNGGVAESPATSTVEADEADQYVFGEEPGDSATDPDEAQRTPTNTSGPKLMHRTDTHDFTAGADHPPGSPFVIRTASQLSPSLERGGAAGGPSGTVPAGNLGGATSEDLEDDAAATWSATLAKEARSRFTRKFVKRQDMIWEMVQTERNYVRLLIAVRDVYRDRFLTEFVHGAPHPGETVRFTAKQAERLFPYVDRLAAIHGAFLHRLCAEQRKREDRAVHDLGDVLQAQFEGASGDEMVRVYGEFYARHIHGKSLLQELRQASPRFKSFLARCEAHPVIRRRSLEDVYLIINQRFSKLETLLIAIVENTINQAEEAAKLHAAKKLLKEITFRAEEMLGESQNKEMLDLIVDHFDPKSTTVPGQLNRSFGLNDISSKERRVLHYGRVKVYRSAVVVLETGSRGGAGSAAACKQGIVECLGLLFTDMFVLLQEVAGESSGHGKRYQFLKEDGPAPSVLPFAYLSNCIVRESPQRHNGEFELYVIFNQANVSFRYSLYTARQEDRAKWAKLLTDAAMNVELRAEEEFEQGFDERLNSHDEKFKRGCQTLSEMQRTDWELERNINIKASLWRRYLEIWDMADLDQDTASADTAAASPSATAAAHEPSGSIPSTSTLSSSGQGDSDADATDSPGAEPSLPSAEDIEGMMRKSLQEYTKLTMLIHSCNTTLTRSQSSAADQAFAAGMFAASGRTGVAGGRRTGGGGGAVHLPRRHETFAGYDSATASKMTAGIYGKRPSLETATSDESVGTSDKGGPTSAKSESTLKVKTLTAIEDSSRRRSSLNISNLLRSFTKTSDKSPAATPPTPDPAAHAAAGRTASGPLSPASPSATSGGTTSSLASPAESGGGLGPVGHLSSVWDWSTEHLPAHHPGPAPPNWRGLATAAGPPNRSAVQSLSELHSETKRLFCVLLRLRTHIMAMHNRLTRAEKDAATLSEQLRGRAGGDRSSWHHSDHPAADSVSLGSGGGGGGFHVVRETEKLRNQRAELERERAEFSKYREREIAKMETEREDLQSKVAALERDQHQLEEAKGRQVEKEKQLQAQIEQHERRLGVRFDAPIDTKALLYPGVEASTGGRRESLPNELRSQSLARPTPPSGSAQSLSYGSGGARETSPGAKSARGGATGAGGGHGHLPMQRLGAASSHMSHSASDLTVPEPGVHLLPMSLAERGGTLGPGPGGASGSGVGGLGSGSGLKSSKSSASGKSGKSSKRSTFFKTSRKSDR